MKAVVFDMDGVLFDTERLVSNAWRLTAEKMGLEDIETAIFDCAGYNHASTKKYMENRYGSSFSYEAFREDYRKNYYSFVERDGFPVMAGVPEMLQFLKSQGARIAMATSSKREGALANLKRTGLTDYFEIIVAGDMVKKGKPDPEIYETACRELGEEPSEIFAVEDSFNGVRSAKGAGMKVIMIPDQVKPTEEILRLVFKRFDSMHEFQNYLEALWKDR